MAAKLDSSTIKISKEMNPEFVPRVLNFLSRVGLSGAVPESCNTRAFLSDFVCNFLKLDRVERGRITCTIFVKAPIGNALGTLHGGALASLAETVSTACARTVVAEDKELFLGELGLSYLSSAPKDSELIADGTVVRSGRNLTVVALEFRLKKTGKLTYTARATFYNSPISKL